MSIEDGIDILIRHLMAIPEGYNVHLPDSSAQTALPRLHVSVPANAQDSRFLAGDTDAYPEISVRIETEGGYYSAQAKAMVRAIQSHFRAGQMLENTVSISQTPDVRGRYNSDGVYYIPMTVVGRMYF